MGRYLRQESRARSDFCSPDEGNELDSKWSGHSTSPGGEEEIVGLGLIPQIQSFMEKMEAQKGARETIVLELYW